MRALLFAVALVALSFVAEAEAGQFGYYGSGYYAGRGYTARSVYPYGITSARYGYASPYSRSLYRTGYRAGYTGSRSAFYAPRTVYRPYVYSGASPYSAGYYGGGYYGTYRPSYSSYYRPYNYGFYSGYRGYTGVSSYGSYGRGYAPYGIRGSAYFGGVPRYGYGTSFRY